MHVLPRAIVRFMLAQDALAPEAHPLHQPL